MKKEDRIPRLVIAGCLLLLIGAGVRHLTANGQEPAAIIVQSGTVRPETVTAPGVTEAAGGDRVLPAEVPASQPEPEQTGAPDRNLNTADEAALQRVSGIGAVLASRITAYRAKIGGFTRRAQLLEIEGIGEALAARILAEFEIPDELAPETTAQTAAPPPRSTAAEKKATAETTSAAEPSLPPKYDLNTVTAAELLTIPGMTPERADAVLRLREQLHGFHSVRELIFCDGLSGTYILDTLSQYLYIEGEETGETTD